MCFTLSTNSKSKSSFFFFAKQSFAKIANTNIVQMKFIVDFGFVFFSLSRLVATVWLSLWNNKTESIEKNTSSTTGQFDTTPFEFTNAHRKWRKKKGWKYFGRMFVRAHCCTNANENCVRRIKRPMKAFCWIQPPPPNKMQLFLNLKLIKNARIQIEFRKFNCEQCKINFFLLLSLSPLANAFPTRIDNTKAKQALWVCVCLSCACVWMWAIFLILSFSPIRSNCRSVSFMHDKHFSYAIIVYAWFLVFRISAPFCCVCARKCIGAFLPRQNMRITSDECRARRWASSMHYYHQLISFVRMHLCECKFSIIDYMKCFFFLFLIRISFEYATEFKLFRIASFEFICVYLYFYAGKLFNKSIWELQSRFCSIFIETLCNQLLERYSINWFVLRKCYLF